MATLGASGSTSGQFDLISFAAGVVTGARSFRVDKLGRLTGINFPQVWLPGENLAECRKASDGYPSAGLSVRMYNSTDIVSHDSRTQEFVMYDGSRIPEHYFPQGGQIGSFQVAVPSPIPATATVSKKPVKDHSLASCQHGFYAYYDGSDDYHEKTYVSGVIEGYGESLIGTRGFRCMKARIVALSIADELAKPVRDAVARNYKDIPLFTSFKDLVKAFPPDAAGAEPAPETDPDFWTRTI